MPDYPPLEELKLRKMYQIYVEPFIPRLPSLPIDPPLVFDTTGKPEAERMRSQWYNYFYASDIKHKYKIICNRPHTLLTICRVETGEGLAPREGKAVTQTPEAHKLTTQALRDHSKFTKEIMLEAERAGSPIPYMEASKLAQDKINDGLFIQTKRKTIAEIMDKDYSRESDHEATAAEADDFSPSNMPLKWGDEKPSPLVPSPTDTSICKTYQIPCSQALAQAQAEGNDPCECQHCLAALPEEHNT